METYCIIETHLLKGSIVKAGGLTLSEAHERTENLNREETNSLVSYSYEVETSVPSELVGV